VDILFVLRCKFRLINKRLRAPVQNDANVTPNLHPANYNHIPVTNNTRKFSIQDNNNVRELEAKRFIHCSKRVFFDFQTDLYSVLSVVSVFLRVAANV